MSNANETVLFNAAKRVVDAHDDPRLEWGASKACDEAGFALEGLKAAVLATQGTIANAAVLGAAEVMQPLIHAIKDAVVRFEYLAEDRQTTIVCPSVGAMGLRNALERLAALASQPSAQPIDTPVRWIVHQGKKGAIKGSPQSPNYAVAVGFGALALAESWMQEQIDFKGWPDAWIEPLYAAPQVAQPSAEAMPHAYFMKHADGWNSEPRSWPDAGEPTPLPGQTLVKLYTTSPTVDQDGMKDASISDISAMRIAAECGVFCTSPQAIAFADAVIKTSIRKSGEQDGVAKEIGTVVDAAVRYGNGGWYLHIESGQELAVGTRLYDRPISQKQALHAHLYKWLKTHARTIEWFDSDAKQGTAYKRETLDDDILRSIEAGKSVDQDGGEAVIAVTEWFPDTVKPRRKGIYQIKTSDHEYQYSWFDGKYWNYLRESRYEAYKNRMYLSWSQNREWRGLSSNPASTDQSIEDKQ